MGAEEIKDNTFIGIASAKSKSYRQGYQCLTWDTGLMKMYRPQPYLQAPGYP